MFNADPGGSITCAITTAWSSSGMKPVGIILNKNPIKIKKIVYKAIVSFLLNTNFLTTSKYHFVISSNLLSKATNTFLIKAVKKLLGCLFGSSARSTIVHIAGDNDKAQTADNAIDTAIHTANCLYIKPDKPATNDTGTNTAISTIAIATNAPPTSCIVS